MTGREPVAHQELDRYLPGHGHSGLRVTRYELDLDYRVTTNRLNARARLHACATQAPARFSLDLSDLRVSRVTVNGRRAEKWAHRGGSLTIWPASSVAVGGDVVIDVEYGGQPRPTTGTWGEVGWEELTDGVIVAGQPDGAPSWFPCNDDPGDKASYRISVTTESAYRVVANGTLVEKVNQASRTRWVYDQPEPMATYLATVQIGRYGSVVTSAGPVRQHAAVPARLMAAFHRDFRRQTQMMDVFQEMFGPYPFAEYVVVVTDDDLEIPLEAQGMSVFGANHVDGRGGSERLVAHELAHQWFGNSLTVLHWQHIWLHEGFACYAEWLWSERSGGPTAAHLARRAWERLSGLRQDIVIGDPGPKLMFDDRLYKRGALTLHALRTTIGDAAFFDVLRAWTSTHRHGSVTTDQFADCVARTSGGSVERLLHDWVAEPRLPSLPMTEVSQSLS